MHGDAAPPVVADDPPLTIGMNGRVNDENVSPARRATRADGRAHFAKSMRSKSLSYFPHAIYGAIRFLSLRIHDYHAK